MFARLRRVQPLAYVFLAVSVVGGVTEVLFHFVPPQSLPGLSQWLAALSPIDRDFYSLLLELIAHIFIAVGLMGMVAVFLYQQLGTAGNH